MGLFQLAQWECPAGRLGSLEFICVRCFQLLETGNQGTGMAPNENVRNLVPTAQKCYACRHVFPQPHSPTVELVVRGRCWRSWAGGYREKPRRQMCRNLSQDNQGRLFLSLKLLTTVPGCVCVHQEAPTTRQVCLLIPQQGPMGWVGLFCKMLIMPNASGRSSR